MWSASLPPSDDLFLDNHIIYALLLIGLALVGAGKTLGFAERTHRQERLEWRWLMTRNTNQPARARTIPR